MITSRVRTHAAVSLLAVWAVLAAWPGLAHGQQPLPPLHVLGQVVAKSPAQFGGLVQARPLGDGRVLVDDVLGARVVILDSSFAVATPVAIVSPAGGAGRGGMIPYYADSSLFGDMASHDMLLVGPSGVVVRSFDAPKGDQGGLGYLYLTNYNAVFDGAGNVVSEWPSQGGRAPIMRVNIVTQNADTVTWVVRPDRVGRVVSVNGRQGMMSMVDSTAATDDWTALTDGTIAVVRSTPFHIDWIARNGTTTASPTIPREPTGGPAVAHPAVVGFNNVKADAAGNVWIRVSESAPDGAFIYDVVNRQGLLVSRVRMPNSVSIVAFGPGVVYLTGPDGPGARLYRARLVGTGGDTLIVAVPPPAPQIQIMASAPKAPRGPTQTTTYKGITVDITEIASLPNREAILSLLRQQIDIVDSVPLPADARALFHSQPIALHDFGGGGGLLGQFVPGTDTVSIATALYDPTRPNLLHELMHAYAYHRLPSGFANPTVLTCYQEARAGGRYPAGSYMLSNANEYFAMVASVFVYGYSPRDPYVRDSIRVKQPSCYQWLGTIFGPH